MEISVTKPIGQAYSAMKRILFKPFNIGKWFTLGFCAFLADLLEFHGGSGGDGRSGFNWRFSSFEEAKYYAYNLILEYWELILTIGWAIIVAGMLLGLLIMWLRCRGKFMLLDGVVHNRGAVVKPWHQYRELANSLLLWRIIVGIMGFACFVLIVLLCGSIAWPDIKDLRFEANALAALIIFGALAILSSIFFGVIKHMLTDFIAPIMYRRGILCGEAIQVFRQEILADHEGSFVLFYLMKFLLGVVAVVIVILTVCMSCCIALIPLIIPYINAVFLLPLAVFFRCYSLYFLEQFDPQWRLLYFAEETAKGDL